MMKRRSSLLNVNPKQIIFAGFKEFDVRFVLCAIMIVNKQGHGWLLEV